MATKGIDVSTIQGAVNWDKVNCDFAMIKATQGRGEGVATRLLRRFTDSRFKYNITHCRCPRGVYHYLTARTKEEAIEEIDYFCKVIAPYKAHISLWAAVDVESVYLNGLGRTELTAVVRTALNRVERNGFKPMLYTNPNFLKYRFEVNAFDDCPIWLAHWGVKTPMSVPNLQIWQYGTTTVPGIVRACDGDVGYFGGEESKPAVTYKLGDKYTLAEGDVYTNGVAVPKAYWGRTYTIHEVKPDAVLIKEILSWVKVPRGGK